jgi:tetratricopeptide (TPR) repeat protein
MWGAEGRHLRVAQELVEWWEDLWQRGIGSQVVLLEVPDGWGQYLVLDHLAGVADGDSGPVTLVVRVDGRALPEERGLQAAVLRDWLMQAGVRHRVAELLGLDRADGVVQAGLGVGGLFVSGPAGALAFLLAGVAVGAAGKMWDDSPAGQDGALARAARSVAAVSESLPVVVIIDHAGDLDEDLALALVDALVSRHGGQVLVVAAVAPGSGLVEALTSRSWYGLLAGRVQHGDVDPDMGFASRLALAADQLPALPPTAARRIAARTRTLAEVLAVSGAGRLAELSAADDDAVVAAAVDAVIRNGVQRAAPSPEAAVLAWAGGLAHASQADAALIVMDATRIAADGDVARVGGVARLTDPADPRLLGEPEALPVRDRQALAAAFVDQAVMVNLDPKSGLVDRAVCGLAAHRVRRWLTGPACDRLPRVQARLAADLEELGDHAAARRTAAEALAEWPPGLRLPHERDRLAATALRLAGSAQDAGGDPLTRRLIAAALSGGAATGLEARLWAAITLLAEPSRREAALNLTDQVATELDAHPDLGSVASTWRLQLAFHAGNAGYPAVTQDLLRPLLTSTCRVDQDIASAVLRAVGGPRADARLQAILLQARLDTTPLNADDDRLRLHHALAADYATLGDYHRALDHARRELDLHGRIHADHHPAVLTTRSDIANWTGHIGDPATALRLNEELFPDEERVLGPGHPRTLRTRGSIAHWTGENGDIATALRLHQRLLPDLKRFLGPDDLGTLTTRGNIASFTGRSGDPATALRLYRELLPDEERVLGPDHPNALATRSNIANWTGQSGNASQALRLYQELLPDRERALGRDHPRTLTTRSDIAKWTGQNGDAATALRLNQELLPDEERVRGRDHPTPLATRHDLAYWATQAGDAATALRLFQELLPDEERILGPDHPKTLNTRSNIASGIGYSGDAPTALRLYRELLPDEERILGPNHRNTLITRQNIAIWEQRAKI